MLDIFFPRICSGCGKSSEETLCHVCHEDIKFISDFSSCAICGIPFGYFNSSKQTVSNLEPKDKGNICGRCINDSFSFEKARSIAIYDGSIRELITSFKYEQKLGNSDVLLDLLKFNYPKDLDEFSTVVPVPLYIDRLRQREFNQSAIIAAGLAKFSGAKCDLFGLKRTRDTVPQIDLKNEKDRKKNVKGAFSISPGKSYEGKSVLLIDDVFTTGSTSDECSKMLLKSGAYKVQVLTLTRAWAM